MKKKLFALTLASLLALSLSSCGEIGGGNMPKPSESSNPSVEEDDNSSSSTNNGNPDVGPSTDGSNNGESTETTETNIEDTREPIGTVKNVSIDNYVYEKYVPFESIDSISSEEASKIGRDFLRKLANDEINYKVNNKRCLLDTVSGFDESILVNVAGSGWIEYLGFSNELYPEHNPTNSHDRLVYLTADHVYSYMGYKDYTKPENSFSEANYKYFGNNNYRKIALEMMENEEYDGEKAGVYVVKENDCINIQCSTFNYNAPLYIEISLFKDKCWFSYEDPKNGLKDFNVYYFDSMEDCNNAVKAFNSIKEFKRIPDFGFEISNDTVCKYLQQPWFQSEGRDITVDTLNQAGLSIELNAGKPLAKSFYDNDEINLRFRFDYDNQPNYMQILAKYELADVTDLGNGKKKVHLKLDSLDNENVSIRYINSGKLELEAIVDITKYDIEITKFIADLDVYNILDSFKFKINYDGTNAEVFIPKQETLGQYDSKFSVTKDLTTNVLNINAKRITKYEY